MDVAGEEESGQGDENLYSPVRIRPTILWISTMNLDAVVWLLPAL